MSFRVTCDWLEEIVIENVWVPSLTTLADLSLDAAVALYGPLSEADEWSALQVSAVSRKLSASIHRTERVAGLTGRPVMLIDAEAHPQVARSELLEWMAPLRQLGSRVTRRDAGEKPVHDGLVTLIGSRHRIAPRSVTFHDKSSDIAVIGAGRRMFNIEIRNWRSGNHDRLKPRDRHILEAGVRIGFTTIFVVPRCTQRFRREIAAYGAEVIETYSYIVWTEEDRQVLEQFSWMQRPIRLVGHETNEISIAVASLITDDFDPATLNVPSAVAVPVRRKTALAGGQSIPIASHQRVAGALELHWAGITTMGEAASKIPISRTTLWRDFKKVGVDPPWARGRNPAEK